MFLLNISVILDVYSCFHGNYMTLLSSFNQFGSVFSIEISLSNSLKQNGFRGADG